MRKTFLILMLLLVFVPCFSQNYMDQILSKSCDCISQIVDTLNIDDYNVALGLCIIDASMPFQKQIKKDYDLDLNNIDDSEVGEKLGQIIGVKMATFCPLTFQKLSSMVSSLKEKTVENNLEITSGLITRIENDFFVVFSIKDDYGKVAKYSWLQFINSDVELTTSYNSLLGKTVQISYTREDFFDPKIEQYRPFYIIRQLKVIQ